MPRTEEKQIKEQIKEKPAAPATKIKWHCRKNSHDLPEDNPNCPDEHIYCKFRTGCLAYHKNLLDD